MLCEATFREILIGFGLTNLSVDTKNSATRIGVWLPRFVPMSCLSVEMRNTLYLCSVGTELANPSDLLGSWEGWDCFALLWSPSGSLPVFELHPIPDP